MSDYIDVIVNSCTDQVTVNTNPSTIVDILVGQNIEDVTLNVTPSLVEINIIKTYSGVPAGTSSEKFYPATTALPITMVNGTDFNSSAKTPVVTMAVKNTSTSKTNNGFAPVLVQYNYTNSSLNVLQSITILDNGFGSLEFDSTFTVV